MAIDVRVVEGYDEAIFQDLIHRNLESMGLFVPEWEYRRLATKSFNGRREKSI